ncbi:MAG: tetratricopeptide repeat protein [Anaerolineales bacterium]
MDLNPSDPLEELDPESSETSEEGWDDLLSTLDYAEPEIEEEEPSFFQKLLGRFRGEKAPATAKEGAGKEKKPKRKAQLTGRQKLVLGVLAFLVVIVYAGFIGVFWMTRPRSAAPEPTERATLPIVSSVGTAQTGESTQAPGADETETETETEATPRPTRTPTPPPSPTPSPTPIPAPPTKFDSEIMNHPNDVDLRIQRGDIYLELDAYRAALADFEHAQSLEKERPEIYIGLGQAYFALRRWDDAKDAFQTAVSFDHTLPEPHFEAGMIYYYQGQYEEAAEAFDWAAELYYQEALQIYEETREIAPAYVRAESWLAIALARSDRVDEGQQAISRTMALTPTMQATGLPEQPIAYVARSWVRRRQSPPAIEAAQGDLLYARELAPFNFEVLNALARFYADHLPERWGEAEQIAQYAVNWAERDIDKARALHTLGRIYIAQGRTEEAKQPLSRAADLAASGGQVALAELSEDMDRVWKRNP